MNSYQTIISELIKQKQLLNDKGYAVNIANNNPSPSEITEAIKKINFDFTVATATEEDVMEGKTFFAQNNELKTGTFSLDIIQEYERIIRGLLSGDIPFACEFPEYCPKIRSYAYYNSSPSTYPELYAQENLIIPNHIREIDTYAFFSIQISNKLYVPANCNVKTSAFQYGTMQEVEFAGTFDSKSNYAIGYCSKLKKLTFLEPFTALTNYCCCQNVKLEEVYLPTTFTSIGSYALDGCSAIKLIKFTATNSPTSIASTAFKSCPNAILLVPYESYYAYYNTTNILRYNNPIVGYGDFEEGDSLPTSVNGQDIVWYPTSDDAVAGTNAITVCPSTGTVYMTYPPTVE